MIYVPMLKTRQEEMRVAKALNYCFSDTIIPLIEILNDEYDLDFKINPKTGDYVYKQCGKRRIREKEDPTEDDIVTLDCINERVDSKLAFIDFFRFTIDKYGKDIDVNKVALSFNLNNNLDLYMKRLNEVSKYQNFIPVISIKKGFELAMSELKSFITDLQNKNTKIALRITEEFLDKYETILKSNLRDNDFLLFDIQEQKPDTKFTELSELEDMDIKACKILLNSPVRVKIYNNKYPEAGYTDLIDTSARLIIEDYTFNGFGDYCGIRDKLPSIKEPSEGAAIALLYDYSENHFWVCTHKNRKMGILGYKYVLPKVLDMRETLDINNDCIGYKEIDSIPKYGSWATWKNICIRRYIHQIFKYLNQ